MDTETKKNYDQIKKILKNIEKTKLEINDNLIKNVAFMTVTLNKLQKEINEKGVIEKFEQGKQKFLRESPALKSYNATFKNYTSAIKQLNELVPEDKKQVEGEDLLKFIASGTK